MSKNRPSYYELVKRNENNFLKMIELGFWKCEYTKRKYILDIQDRLYPEIYNLFDCYDNYLLDHAARFLRYHVDMIFRIGSDTSVCMDSIYAYLEQLIIVFHNFKYGDNPKYRIENITGPRFDVLESFHSFDDRQIDSIRILHADARKYGFFPMDMTKIYPINEVEIAIKQYKEENGKLPKIPSPFLIDKNQCIDFYYKNREGKQFFVNEDIKDAVCVYVDCLDEKESVDSIYRRALGLINKAKKNKHAHTAGDIDGSDIQICIYDKKIIQNKEKLKEILVNNFLEYRNYQDPNRFMLTEGTIRVGKHLMVPKYEGVPFDKRAAGLWIWDQVHLYKIELSDAIRQARKIESFKLFDSIEDSSVWRWYNLAKKSIEKMDVLKISDLKR